MSRQDNPHPPYNVAGSAPFPTEPNPIPRHPSSNGTHGIEYFTTPTFSSRASSRPGFRRSAWQIGTWWSPPFPHTMLHAQSYARSVRIRIEEGPPIHHSGLGRLLNRFPPHTNLPVPLSNIPTPAITSNDTPDSQDVPTRNLPEFGSYKRIP